MAMNNKTKDNKFDCGDLVHVPPSTDVHVIQAVRKIPGQTPTYKVLNLERTERQHLSEDALTKVR